MSKLLVALRKFLSDETLTIDVRGSLIKGTHTPYSDTDIVVRISKEQLTEVAEKNEKGIKYIWSI